MRRSPLEDRKRQLAKLLRKASRALHFNEHIDDEPGDVVFRHACQLGLEGHCLKAAWLALSLRPNAIQVEEPRPRKIGAKGDDCLVRPWMTRKNC